VSTSSVKAPDPKGRKTLGGTDESSWDKGCTLASLDCDEGKDSNELSGGVGGPIELDDGDDHCVESGGKRLLNSVIIDQSEFSKENEESTKWGKAAKEVDRSRGPAGIGNCNKELRSCSEPKSLEKLDVNVASCPGFGGSRSWDERSELGT
jgi:hypothetical protein